MHLNDKELLMFEKLGFTIKDGQIVEVDQKLSFEDLDYAGFNVYVSKDNRVFEKMGEELVEISTLELEAERRFIENKLKS
jgi:hypothetical protein